LIRINSAFPGCGSLFALAAKIAGPMPGRISDAEIYDCDYRDSDDGVGRMGLRRFRQRQ
jgi:hypothetical protein